MKITTQFVYPPIPVRTMDYSAIDDDTYDGAPDAHCPVGHGATEEEAIRNLAEQWEELELAELERLEADARERNDATTLRFLGYLRGED